MNRTEYILQSIPPFSHLLQSELSSLRAISRTTTVKKGMSIDLKKSSSLHIVLSGTVEVEGTGRSDVVYLPSGSFFGSLPFCEQKNRGILRATTDAVVLILDESALYRYFLSHFRALRGYIRILDRMGFAVSDTGRDYSGNRTRIISSFSAHRKAGTTLLASLLGFLISDEGKTVILDLSYDGNSLFNCFEQKITSPLSHRRADDEGVEDEISKRIVQVNENLHLLNVSSGSRVRVNPDILSPVLLLLSRKYRYIILDVPDGDTSLRDRALSLSDYIFAIVRKNEPPAIYNTIDAVTKDGQRVYYVINEHTAGKISGFNGLVMEKYKSDGNLSFDDLSGLKNSGVLSSFTSLVKQRVRSLILETRGIDSLLYAGFFNSFDAALAPYEIIYSSHWAYIVAALYSVAHDYAGFRKGIEEFFSERRMASFLDVTFPENNVFKNNAIRRYTEEIFGQIRIEEFTAMPVARIESDDGERMASSGFLRDITACSWVVCPHFEPVFFGGAMYHSGYPETRSGCGDLLRSVVDEIDVALAGDDHTLAFESGRMLGFFRSMIRTQNRYIPGPGLQNLADRTFILPSCGMDYKVKKIIDYSEKEWLKLLENKKQI